MSLAQTLSAEPVLTGLGALLGLAAGPSVAAVTLSMPSGRWPWQERGGGWWSGGPASLRRVVGCGSLLAVVLGTMAPLVGWRPALLGFVGLAVLGVALAVIDLATHRLPDPLTFTGFGLGGVGLLLDALVTGSWSALLRAILVALVLGGVLLFMALVTPRGMGLGDAKLVALIGLHTGWFGWSVAALGLLGGFVVGAVVALALMAGGKAGLRTAVPFGPSLLAGAWLVLVLFG